MKDLYPDDVALDLDMSRIFDAMRQKEKALGILKEAAEVQTLRKNNALRDLAL